MHVFVQRKVNIAPQRAMHQHGQKHEMKKNDQFDDQRKRITHHWEIFRVDLFLASAEW
jgi:hypothetical protein